MLKVELDAYYDTIREICIEGGEILVVPYSYKKDIDFKSVFSTENVEVRTDSLFLSKGLTSANE